MQLVPSCFISHRVAESAVSFTSPQLLIVARILRERKDPKLAAKLPVAGIAVADYDLQNCRK